MDVFMEILQVILLSFGSMAMLFVLTRLEGKCSISQLNLFDYITSITIGNIAAEMATNLEEWYKPFTAMLIYGLMAALIGWLRCKWLPLRKWINGRPTVLLQNGMLLKENLLKVKLDLNEFMSQCRIAGFFDLGQLEYAVMEPNGQISFLPKCRQRPATPTDLKLYPPEEGLFIPLILDGKLLVKNLERTGKNDLWLREQLHANSIGQISEVFLACCDEWGNFRAYRMPKENQNRELPLE